jgi:hypothetical protein
MIRVATRSFPSSIASAWSPHEEVFKGNASLACGKQSVTLQAANFAVHDVTSFDRDDLIFCLATWAAEGIGSDWLIVAKDKNAENESGAYVPLTRCAAALSFAAPTLPLYVRASVEAQTR